MALEEMAIEGRQRDIEGWGRGTTATSAIRIFERGLRELKKGWARGCGDAEFGTKGVIKLYGIS